jgi:hypothetical protein
MSEEEIPGSGAASRESKHIVLHNSLKSLQDVKEHAIDLLDEIRESPRPEGEPVNDVKPLQSSLLRVLDESPETIKNQCSEIHDILNEIRSLIF